MSKGDETRLAVLDQATMTASRVGLSGVTIGTLAEQTHMSKSGLFAHFGSKESLQLETMRHARQRFIDIVLRPALAGPRGEPRVQALIDGWLRWDETMPGGCLFVAAGVEFDDSPGPQRDEVARIQREFSETIARIFRSGVTAGHFREDADPEQFAFVAKGLLLSYHHHRRLLGDATAEQRTRRAFDALLAAARSESRPTASDPA